MFAPDCAAITRPICRGSDCARVIAHCASAPPTDPSLRAAMHYIASQV